MTSFKILENGNYVITLLEKYPCDCKEELHSRERYWCKQIDCCNKCKPGLFNELGKVEYDKQYNKKYYEDNKAKLQQKHSCECGGCYTTCHKAHHLKSKKHQEYLKNRKWHIMHQGFQIIKKLDKHFSTN